MITTTLERCATAFATLQRLAALPAPPRLAYRLAKLVRKVQPEVAHFHTVRDSLVREYGTGTDGINYTVPPDRRDAFVADVATLAAIVVEIPVDPLTFEEIEVVCRDGIAASDVLALEGFLVETEAIPSPVPR